MILLRPVQNIDMDADFNFKIAILILLQKN